MRIISGNSKGKKVLEPKDLNTRPLRDLTKESIFNILTHSNKFNIILKNSNVLDLFSGVGSFGLECLSRRSEYVTFVENYNNVLPILKKNIVDLGYQKNSFIIEKDIINNLNFTIFKKKFDIIFLDPPYKESRLSLILNNIIKADILKDGGIIIIHRHKKEKDNFAENFYIFEEKTYGISKVIFGSYFK
ncbi:16S rRNA (guanine(966)-N(2))-methyltransferase RsmD [Candidatus Pelagibacter sp.]|jgi:16S rRNA (guanine966-N2)-methyltransferase|nr:16S rRNA (guanine(966)-N(2))-methyltransferase RsmD [Candidatus Pelagibacter sp.]|tara:strand:+ start:5989 stop:6555 length:567 start_codon:yes stop_codon:yes gene_type:complete